MLDEVVLLRALPRKWSSTLYVPTNYGRVSSSVSSVCSVALWPPILLGWTPICICDRVGIILCFFWIFLVGLTTKISNFLYWKIVSLSDLRCYILFFLLLFVVIICIFLSLLHCYFYAHWRGTNAVYFPAVGYFPFLLTCLWLLLLKCME